MRTIRNAPQLEAWANSSDPYGILTGSFKVTAPGMEIPPGKILERRDPDVIIDCGHRSDSLKIDGVIISPPVPLFANAAPAQASYEGTPEFTLPSVHGHNGGQPRHAEWFGADANAIQCGIDFGPFDKAAWDAHKVAVWGVHHTKVGRMKTVLLQPLDMVGRRCLLEGAGWSTTHLIGGPGIETLVKFTDHRANKGGRFDSRITNLSMDAGSMDPSGSMIDCLGTTDEKCEIDRITFHTIPRTGIWIRGGINGLKISDIVFNPNTMNNEQARAIAIEFGPGAGQGTRGHVTLDRVTFNTFAHTALLVDTACGVQGRAIHVEHSRIHISGSRARVQINGLQFNHFKEDAKWPDTGVTIDSSDAHVTLEQVQTLHRTKGMTIVDDKQTKFKSSNLKQGYRRTINRYARFKQHKLGLIAAAESEYSEWNDENQEDTQ